MLEGFEDLYEVSNKGRVRSVDRVFVRKNGRIQPVKGKILKQTKDKDGYCKVYLSNQGIEKNVFVHRLVAEAFIPNPDNLPQVNHINSKKDDNRVENLEWITNQQNVQHAYDFGNGLKGLDHPNARQIGLFDNGKLISVFESVTKCAEILNIPKKTLRKYIQKEKYLFQRLLVKYINDDFDEYLLNLNPFKRTLINLQKQPICITDKDGNILGIYESREVAEQINNFPKTVLMPYKTKKIPYKDMYYIKDITQYEYLICDDKYINRKL